jgi:hypothetical protein
MLSGRLTALSILAWAVAAAGPKGCLAAGAELSVPGKGTVPFSLRENRDSPQPLAAIVQWAGQTAARVEKEIHDYTAILAKREMAGGTVGEPQYLYVKVRHQPFSVYVHILTPPNKAGEEGIYVKGRNDGNLLGHTTGWLGKLTGTLALDPTGSIAMKDHLHPITETGILHLTRQIEAFAKRNVRQTGCTVESLPGASINGRKATCVRVAFPVATAKVKAYLIRVFVDDKLQLPIRYESYEWPGADGAAPVLLEEYTYLDLRLNPGLTDADFDPKNKNYAFP